MHLRHTHLVILLALVAAILGCSESSAVGHHCTTSSEPRLVEFAPPGDVSYERSRGLNGTVTIEVLVDERANLAEARISKSSSVPSLDRAAMYAVRYSTFAPGACDGKPVAGKVTVEMALP